MVNKAVTSNPSTADLHLATSGSDWDWAVFAVMLVSDLVLIGWTYTRPRGARLFDNLGIIILTTATISYFCMASNLGHTPIEAQFLRGRDDGTTRAIWYVRYIEYFITAPLLLLLLLLATGINISSIVLILFFQEMMVIMGLIGALTHSAYKWGFYGFGIASLIYIWVNMFLQVPSTAGFLGPDVEVHYWRCAGYLMFFWLLYPVCWALCEGGNVISPTSEMFFYGVLDLLTKPVFIAFLLFSMKDIDFERFGLSSLKASETANEAAAHPGYTTSTRQANVNGVPATTGTTAVPGTTIPVTTAPAAQGTTGAVGTQAV